MQIMPVWRALLQAMGPEVKLKDKKEQLAKGQRIALLSALLIFALALVKAFVGYLFNSPLLIADAWHSGADILINLSSLAGLKIAARKKSSRFPYGLYRAETIASLLIGGVIVYVGSGLVKEGWHRLFMQNLETDFPAIPIFIAAVSCAVSLILAVKQRAIGLAIGSQALLATAREAFFDIFTSLFVLLGMVFVFIRVPFVEGAVILLIAGFIIKLGIETAWRAIMILMDANLDQELKTRIEKALGGIDGVTGVEWAAVRQSGPFKIVTCIIRTSSSLRLYQSHALADTAENMLLEKYQSIESVFVHVEPEKGLSDMSVIPVGEKKGLEARLFEQFGKAPYFMMLRMDGDPVEIESYLENQYLENKGHIGLNVVKSILDSPIGVVFVSRIGEISFHMLRDHGVDVFKVNRRMTARQIIDAYRENRLDPVIRPNEAKQYFE